MTMEFDLDGLREAYVTLLRHDFPWVPSENLEAMALECIQMDSDTWDRPPSREELRAQAQSLLPLVGSPNPFKR
jgi:hypothetical protein